MIYNNINITTYNIMNNSGERECMLPVERNMSVILWILRELDGLSKVYELYIHNICYISYIIYIFEYVT